MAHDTTATSVNLTEAARCERVFRINGFTATRHKPLSFSASRRCLVGGHDWQVVFHANRSHPSDSGGGGWVMFRLRLMSKSAPAGVAASFACRLVDHPPNGSDSPAADSAAAAAAEEEEQQIVSASFHIHEFQDVYLARRSDLETDSGPPHRRRFLRDDCLLVHCAITVLLGVEPKKSAAGGGGGGGTPASVPSADLHRQLGELLRSQKGADVTFLVSGERVPAHRSVLAARSPVFMAQLFGGDAASSPTVVEVRDMEAEVFRAMLRFVYTDTSPELELEQEHGGVEATAMAQQLLEAAGRYGLGRLKRICEEKVFREIRIDSVAATLALAEQHGCAKLKASCMRFILANPENLAALTATAGYKRLEATCPSVLTELLLGLVRRARNKW